MNEELIQKIANEILNETILSNWKFYGLIVVLVLVSSSLSVFLLSYFKKRGESYATKSDFDELLNQTKKVTVTTEQIKSEILTKFSREEEKRKILRDKIECSIEESYNILSWLEKSRTLALGGNYFELNGGNLEKLETLQMIYFPEFSTLVSDIKTKIHPYQEWILSLHSEAINSKAEYRQPNHDISTFITLYKPVVESLSKYREELTDKYRGIIL